MDILRWTAALGHLLANAIAPPQCAACDDALRSSLSLFCPPCAATVEPAEGDGEGAGAPFEYGGAIATAIARLKYLDRPDLAPRLGQLLASETRAEETVTMIDLVVPVPLHPTRLANRGYNQAALIAAALARARDLRFAPRALARVRDTPRQATLDRRARLANLHHAFIVRDAMLRLVHDARILLIDDVRTTGATLEGCASALHEAGARSVTPLVLARRT